MSLLADAGNARTVPGTDLAVSQGLDTADLARLKALLEKDGGFARCYFEPNRENEKRIKEETKATVRCVPFDQPGQSGPDIFTGKETSTEVIFAIAY